MAIEVVSGVLKAGNQGSESVVTGIREFSIDEEFDYGEARNEQYPTYANQIKGQDSWSASLSVDLYASEGADAASTTLAAEIQTLRSKARNHEDVSIILQYGNPSGAYGQLGYVAVEETAKGKITSMSMEGSFMADGEVWTTDMEVEGFQPWTTV